MFRKELTYYFASPVAYIVIGLYVLAVSLFLWVIPGSWYIIDNGYADLRGLFELSPWLLMLLCPALTMRLISEERQSGTWDLLRAKRVSVSRIVLAKYAAAWVLTLLAVLPNALHYAIVYYVAEPMGNVDGGVFIGSMAGLALLSALFTAIGLLAASLTRSQIVAYIVGATACLALYWVAAQARFSAIGRGVIDLRDVLFFAALTVVALVLAVLCNHSSK